MAKKIRVAMKVMIEVDPEDWTTAFGVEGTAAIRNDVREYWGEIVTNTQIVTDGEIDAVVTWAAP